MQNQQQTQTAQGGVIALRTMTLASKLGFGPYPEMTIKEFIEENHLDYLKFLYYKNSQVNFKDDILDILGIETEDRIPKPGINLELANKFEHKEPKKVFKNPYLFGQNKRSALRMLGWKEFRGLGAQRWK